MNIKREIIAAVVRALADKTTLIRKPSDFEELVNTMFGGESYDKRIAKEIEAEAERVLEVAKRANIRRQFKKITKDF